VESSYAKFWQCYFARTNVTYTVESAYNASLYQYRCKTDVAAANVRAARSLNSTFRLSHGSVFDGNGVGNAYGAQVHENGSLNCYSSAANGYARARNLQIAMYAEKGGQITSTGNNQYSGNTADETAIAGSYGYID
jgi:hypothetical protein